jgi:hypothetical protein
VLLCEKRKLEKPSGPAATVAAAASQKRRRLISGFFFIANSWQLLVRLGVPAWLTTQAGSEQAAEGYLYCAGVYKRDTLV